MFYIGVVSDTCRDGRGLLLADDDIGNILLSLLADSLPLCTLCETARQSESGKSILSFQELSLLLQVVDGFFVKRVQDVRESAAYLTVMTRYLTKLYQVCLLFLGSEVRVMETAVCLMCFKRNLFFFFLPNLNFRTAR